MDRATLGEIPGGGEAHSRLASEARREYRGTFAFRAEHTAEMARLLESGDVVEYEGRIDGTRQRLRVVVTDVAFHVGLASFAGRGEPYSVSRPKAAGQ